MTAIRLDKYLADMQVGTRSQVKEMIRKGRVEVDHIKCMSPSQKIPSDSLVTADGKELRYVQMEYYMLNKPAGVLSAARDNKTKTVVDLIAERRRKDLFPVGRLDKDTEGLLLITNDGALAHALLSPQKHVDKVYFAKVAGLVSAREVQQFSSGLILEDGTKTRPARLEIIRAESNSEILLTLQEGKFHQVKRMFQAVGMEVLYLKRLSMGPLRLDEQLETGAYRELTAQEIKALWACRQEK